MLEAHLKDENEKWKLYNKNDNQLDFLEYI